MIINCPYCNKKVEKEIGVLNCAKKGGYKVYCSRVCSGLARRITTEEKKKLKAAYDVLYREKNLTEIKQKKALYFQKTYDPEKAKVYRKTIAPRHAEYCRQPEYRKWKKKYDTLHRAKKQYGDFGEAAVILFELENIIDRYEADQLQGTLNKSQQRKKIWKNLQRQT
jgi:hypothetical protein